jgi:DNA replication protein DnaC
MNGPKKPSGEDLRVYECELCRDSGVIFNLEKNVGYVCSCQERKKLKRLLKSCNISDEFVHKNFGNFTLKGMDKRVVNAYRIAKEYSDGLVDRVKRGEGLRGAPWMGLLGTSGCGKTHLVTAAAYPLIELGMFPMFFNWVQSFTEWFAYYNKPEEAYKVDEIRQRIYNCDILIVDDICKESQKDTWIKEFYGIVDYRYRKQLPIIYTSEYFYQLVGFLSKATAGRLFEKTKNPETGKMYLAKMLLAENEDPLALDYRFRDIF